MKADKPTLVRLALATATLPGIAAKLAVSVTPILRQDEEAPIVRFQLSF